MEPIVIIFLVLAVVYGIGSYLWVRRALSREKAEVQKERMR
jgi:predicted permease